MFFFVSSIGKFLKVLWIWLRYNVFFLFSVLLLLNYVQVQRFLFNSFEIFHFLVEEENFLVAACEKQTTDILLSVDRFTKHILDIQCFATLITYLNIFIFFQTIFLSVRSKFLPKWYWGVFFCLVIFIKIEINVWNVYFKASIFANKLILIFKIRRLFDLLLKRWLTCSRYRGIRIGAIVAFFWTMFIDIEEGLVWRMWL